MARENSVGWWRLTLMSIAASMTLVACIAFAQPPDTLWTRLFPVGTFNDAPMGVAACADGGLVIAGQTSLMGMGGYDVYLVKTNAQGNTLWTRCYGGPNNDFCYGLRQTSDGGYILVGLTGIYPAWNLYVVKTDPNGLEQWHYIYNGGSDDYGRSVCQCSDGGYVICGTTMSGGYAALLLKLSASGNYIWHRIFNRPGTDNGWCAQQTQDGGYIISGQTNTYQDGWLIKTDADGYQQWERIIYGCNEGGFCVQQTEDGGYIITGGGPGGLWLIRTDSLGHTLWIRTYGGAGQDGGRCVQITADGGYVVSGYTNSYGSGGNDIWLLKTDANGDTLWTRTYGGTGFDDGRSVQQTNDGGYVLSGCTSSYGVGGLDYWIIKTDALGDSIWNCTFGGGGSDVAFEIHQIADGGYVVAGDWNDNWYAGTSDIYVVRLAGPAIGQVAIALDPVNPPIVIPSQGGTFSFNITLTNDSTTYQAYNVWCSVELPNGLQYPVLGPVTLAFPPGFNITRSRSQAVPARAPAGDYIYWGCIGYPPWTVLASDSFTFVKEGVTADWPGMDGWACTGELLPGEKPQLDDAAQSESVMLHPCHPNPFNPKTNLSFTLPETGNVTLTVYDVRGAEVIRLIDRWLPAGEYHAIFDGSNLASGIYLAWITVGNSRQMQKMLLIK